MRDKYGYRRCPIHNINIDKAPCPRCKKLLPDATSDRLGQCSACNNFERRYDDLLDIYGVLLKERDKYKAALLKILPEQDPLQAEILCDYCGASVPWDEYEAQDEHKPDCPWLLVHGAPTEQVEAILSLREARKTEQERCIDKLLELVPMCDPELTREYLREELAKP